MLLRLHSTKTGDVRIYDLAHIEEEDAVMDFMARNDDEATVGCYFEFSVVSRTELEWWVRTGGVGSTDGGRRAKE
jgi:hypothetical protein